MEWTGWEQWASGRKIPLREGEHSVKSRDQTPKMASPEALLPGPASKGLGFRQQGTGFLHKVDAAFTYLRIGVL